MNTDHRPAGGENRFPVYYSHQCSLSFTGQVKLKIVRLKPRGCFCTFAQPGVPDHAKTSMAPTVERFGKRLRAGHIRRTVWHGAVYLFIQHERLHHFFKDDITRVAEAVMLNRLYVFRLSGLNCALCQTSLLFSTHAFGTVCAIYHGNN